MARHGGAPISSSLYMTKRARLAKALTKDKESGDVGITLKELGELSCLMDSLAAPDMVETTSDDREVHRGLVELAVRRMNLLPLDMDVDESHVSAPDGLDDGVKFLSRQRCVASVATPPDVAPLIPGPSQGGTPLTGRLYDIVSMLDAERPRRSKGVLSKRVATGANGVEALVGPLSANEVAQLLLLAQKLQDTNRMDDTLEKHIEMSANVWKQTGKVPNVVATAVVVGLYEGKPSQCATCGMRFSSIDAKQVHTLSHDTARSEVLWSTIDEWVAAPDVPSAVRSTEKAMMTVQGMGRIFGGTEEPVSPNLQWLREVLFPRAGVASAAADLDMDSDHAEGRLDEALGETAGALNERVRSLWSWGTMEDCKGVTAGETQGRGAGTIGVESDKFILLETCHKVGTNVARMSHKVPFPAGFANLTRRNCVVCCDYLRVEFSITYDCFVYCDSVCFKLDSGYIKRAFQDEQVSCKLLLATNGLRDMEDPFLVLRKMAAITLLKSNLHSKRDAGFTDWSFRRERAIVGDQTLLPERNTMCPDRHQLAVDLARRWQGPFDISGCGSGSTNGLMYAHTGCLGYVFNAHTRRAKELSGSSSCAQQIASLKLVFTDQNS
ncbi:SMART RPR domain at NH2 terminus, SMART AZnF_C2H2 [Babesia caballi]|uniref:SMART RPR domain at NH2 terminus, SMART AZnF_C2H2 n=1 Tax=Babesia caballi TaxID=5871 RepID=A0AAV4LRB0_BABCB|nr:SMART RPR domain at NH2 terminus, SMART AZnF_C2H2 [Babesia caballi]